MQVTGQGEEQRHPAWVRSRLEWASVEAARARLAGEPAETPSMIGDVELAHLSREFHSWWLEARGGKIMPAPEDVNPRALVELLPYIRYLSWEAEDRLVFRIYGSALEAATGIDLTGTNTFGDGIEYPGRDEDMARLKLLHSHPCGLLLIRELMTPDGSPCLCELITLPIAAGEDGKNRVIGTVTARERMAETEVDFKLSPPLTLRRAIFFDIGCGVPEAAGLTV